MKNLKNITLHWIAKLNPENEKEYLLYRPDGHFAGSIPKELIAESSEWMEVKELN